MDWPNDSTVRWLVRRYASLLARDESPSTARKLVLPTSEFFPDAFDGDAGSVNLLFWRLQEHANLTELDIELRFIDDRDEAQSGGGGGCSTGSCSSSACATTPKSLSAVAGLPDGAYRVDVRLSDARNAVTMTSALATSLAHVWLLETGGFDWPEEEWLPTCELAAVMLGFGVLLANASYMFSKGCGGVHVDRATSLQVTDLALAHALFVALRDQVDRGFTGKFELTQREAYGEARMWVESNAKLVKRLRRDPGEVAADEHITLLEAKPWLARVLGLGRKKKRSLEVFDEDGLADFELAMKQKKVSAVPKREKTPDLEDIRALVDESLEEVRAAREP